MDSPHLRAAGSDRTRTSSMLVAHHRAGRLEADELGARLALAEQAKTEEELRLLVADLPDVPGPAQTRKPERPEAPPSALGIAFDICVMLLGMAAFVCTGLLVVITLGMNNVGPSVALGVFGAFTTGAAAVHLAHRLVNRR